MDISPGGGLGQGSDEDFAGFFALFLMEKVRSARQVCADLPRHDSSWTPAAFGQPSGSIEQETEKEKELKAEEEEDEDPTGWTLAYDNYGRQYFWHRRTRRTALGDSGIRHTEGEGDEEEEEEETYSWFLIFTLLSCTDTAMWAWTRSRSPWFPHVFIAVLLLWPRSPSFPAVASAGMVWLVASRVWLHLFGHVGELVRYCVIAGFADYDAPRAVFPSFVHVRGDSTGAVLGPAAMPRCCVWCRWPDSALLCRFHRCCSWTRSFKCPVHGLLFRRP